jgi:hypothetical protein
VNAAQAQRQHREWQSDHRHHRRLVSVDSMSSLVVITLLFIS